MCLEGGTVGYGGTWRAERPTRIAVLPVGYGDGYLRGTQPGAEVLVRGRRVPLVGRVSMDAVTVDVTDLPGLDYAEEFVLLGSQGGENDHCRGTGAPTQHDRLGSAHEHGPDG